MDKNIKTVIISRTDNLGDVMLTLPLCGILKESEPTLRILFIGKKYTRPLIESCEWVDLFIDASLLNKVEDINSYQADAILFIYPDKKIAKLAKEASIPIRVGTSHRLFHWLYCNKRINFSRKTSDLHEAELNQFLLKGLGINTVIQKEKLHNYYGFTKLTKEPIGPIKALISDRRKKVILHPKSKGSAKEWSLHQYNELIKLLHKDDYVVYITGTKEEGEAIEAQFPDIYNHDNVVGLEGKFSLSDFILLIKGCDYFVSCSTGPLHIASALGLKAIGIYPPIKPINPNRWQPLGSNAQYLTQANHENCNRCLEENYCICINEITPKQILDMF